MDRDKFREKGSRSYLDGNPDCCTRRPGAFISQTAYNPRVQVKTHNGCTPLISDAWIRHSYDEGASVRVTGSLRPRYTLEEHQRYSLLTVVQDNALTAESRYLMRRSTSNRS